MKTEAWCGRDDITAPCSPCRHLISRFRPLSTQAKEKQHVIPESLVLALTRLRDFLVEIGVTSLSLPVYDPKRGKLHQRELYALVHVIFSETDIEVYLHKKYYLSIC